MCNTCSQRVAILQKNGRLSGRRPYVRDIGIEKLDVRKRLNRNLWAQALTSMVKPSRRLQEHIQQVMRALEILSINPLEALRTILNLLPHNPKPRVNSHGTLGM